MTLLNCTGIEVKNTRVCTVAGVMAVGADCAYTRSDKTESMNFDQYLSFLEPQAAVKDAKGKVITPERAGAMCQSADDWNSNIEALQKACAKLGTACSPEIKEPIDQAAANSQALQQKAVK